MLHTKLKMIQERAAQANKAVLEAEKARDELHNQIGPPGREHVCKPVAMWDPSADTDASQAAVVKIVNWSHLRAPTLTSEK
jgi:hypothetical protein